MLHQVTGSNGIKKLANKHDERRKKLRKKRTREQLQKFDDTGSGSERNDDTCYGDFFKYIHKC